MKFLTFKRQGKYTSDRLKELKAEMDNFVEQELVDELHFHFNEAESEYADFKNNLTKLLANEKIDDYDNDEVLVIRKEISTIYLSIKLLIKPFLQYSNQSNVNDSVSSRNKESAQDVKLPPLVLKTFNGSPDQWLSFFNLFEASVANNLNINQSQKMQYLLTSLQGEPLNLIKNLEITPENYDVAWNILKQRYQNSRKIVTYHINNIIDLPNVSYPTSKNLRSLISSFQENFQALLSLKHDINKENIILSSLILRKLDIETRKKFEESRPDSQKLPEAMEIISFLENECNNMEAAGFSPNYQAHKNTTITINKQQFRTPNETFTHKPMRTVLMSSDKTACTFCGNFDHNIYGCLHFKDLSPENKLKHAKEKRLCLNCLGSSHSIKECKSKRVCFHCKKKHHTWLHLKPQITVSSEQSHVDSSTESNPQKSLLDSTDKIHTLGAFSNNNDNKPTTILLGTTLVHVTSNNGNSLVIRAVVDSGSMITCISEYTARLLSLERHADHNNNVNGLSSCQIKTKGISRINISSLNGMQVANNHPVILLDKITSNLPHVQVPSDVKNRFQNVILADPTFGTPSSVDMLIGADLFAKIITGERIIIGDDLPAALNSVFGYILIGSVPVVKPSQDIDCVGITTLLTTQDFNLHQSLTRFWVQEEVSCSLPESPEEIFCENHFITHHKRDSSGSYIVRLPFKKGHPTLGNSSENAKRRFLSLERKMDANPEFKKSYIEGMNDYIQSGHMELVTTPIPEDSANFVLPHHSVIKEESSTTKLRIVFDASMRSSSGVSLNHILHAGQKLHNAISDIILGFRCYPIVFSCDIKKMFRQIKMDPQDQNYQLLFWRENSSQPLSIYRLTTLVFGFTSSPYLALRTLKQLVKDESDKFPLAAQAIEKQLYVDDLILGSNSIEEALHLQKETIELLSKGGFHLRKFTSNHSQLVTNVPESHRERPIFFQNSDNPLYSVLGIKWLADTDHFAYRQQTVKSKPTKRNILSIISQIYDPCGWLAPVTFATKSLIQVLWTLGLQWDESVPADISEKWERFISQLPELNKIHIPRYVSIQGAVEVQLHGFSDASEAGFSAVVYIRCISQDNNIEVFLLIAKSRVAPLKKISVPRLELCGAHLLAKLLHYSESIISPHHSINSINAWTDSSVVLSWIHTPPFRLKVYAANRVTEIQDLTPAHYWNHVSTHDNPADCASRGLLPSLLKNHHLWWNGPSWLKLPQDTWPIPRYTLLKGDDLPEIKSEPLPVLVTTQSTDFEPLKRFSSWIILLRVIAFVLRFIHNSKGQNKKTGYLSTSELDEAKFRICQFIQKSAFQEDLSRLRSGKPSTSRLLSLSPFIDEMGLIRVGGRLQHSNVTETTKHPIILPKSHYITNLIIDYFHVKYLHAGPHFLQASIAQDFWILSARSAIRSRLLKCVRCYRCKPKQICQKMGNLPKARVIPTRPFYNCGTDFLGPFLIKINSLRKAKTIKVYLCLFICFAVKAIHIEVVSDLTTEAFIATLTRFVSRRGLCANIYSDCGTNYVGASLAIQKIFKDFLKQEDTKQAIDRFSTENKIKFHFQPPAAPHQGGLWERSVRSVKNHLRRVIGHQILTLEEFITLSTRVEAILNSRPITPLSSDPTEINCLTPGHFLVGGPLIAIPENNWNNVPINKLTRWQLIQSLGQSFWKRWKREYLQTLQQRAKWRTPEENIKIGDVVIIHESNEPPLNWKLGRVISTSPGPDGLVRVVQLQTQKGTLSRPIVKVSPLPIDQ